MQFAVPQFIDIEDKIIGPFTLKQFLYLAGAAGILFLLFFILRSFLFFIIAPFVAALSLALAFYRINGRDFIFFLNSLANFYIKPRFYLWKKLPKKPKKEKTIKKEPEEVPKKVIQSKLKKIAWQLDIMGGAGEEK